MPTTIIDILLKAGITTPSADNSQPWRFIITTSTLSIIYDTKRVLNKTFKPDASATFLSMGALLENLSQICSAAKVTLQWNFPDTFNPDNPIYFETLIDQNIKNLDNNKLEKHPLFNRHTYRFSFQKKTISSQLIDSINCKNTEYARVITISNKRKITEITNLVKLASQIRFKTQEIHEWLGKSLRFGQQSIQTCDGLDVATLDIPPGGALFLRFISDWRRMKIMNFFGVDKLMSWIDSAPIKKAPALVAIIGRHGFRESLSAGQLMQRIWIDLNDQGIAVHPYYVVSDQMNRLKDNTVPQELRQQAEQVNQQAIKLFDLQKDEVLHMLFRIGYPDKKAKRSRRLPLEKLYSSSPD